MNNHPDGITAYLNAIRALQDGIWQQTETFETIADLMTGVVVQEHRIFLFSIGHSQPEG
jgi:uncharacterized phosphosugar-binding protein